MALLWSIGLLLVGLGVWWWLWWLSEESKRQPHDSQMDWHPAAPPPAPPAGAPVPSATPSTAHVQALRATAAAKASHAASVPLTVVAPPSTVAANDATLSSAAGTPVPTPSPAGAPGMGQEPASAPATGAPPAAPHADAEAAPTADAATSTLPPSLAELHWLPHEALPEPARQALVDRLRALPRPPLAVHQVLSPDFVETTNSIDLSIMIKGQPAITAKVLSTVNSPLYGLLQPVTNTGQAITFLGLNTVRNLCLQYMLMAPTSSVAARQQAVLDHIGQSITLASELCVRLSQKLQLPDTGTLVTQVVLYFLGQLVGYGFWPSTEADAADHTWALPLPQRMAAETEQLGLSAAEIGALLLQEWQIPAELVQEVRDIDRIALTPASALDEARGVRLALCYLCIRLGERIARNDDWAPESLLQIGDATDPEWFHLQDYLQHPALQELPEALQVPELHATLRALRATAPMRL